MTVLTYEQLDARLDALGAGALEMDLRLDAAGHVVLSVRGSVLHRDDAPLKGGDGLHEASQHGPHVDRDLSDPAVHAGGEPHSFDQARSDGQISGLVGQSEHVHGTSPSVAGPGAGTPGADESSVGDPSGEAPGAPTGVSPEPGDQGGEEVP